MLTERMIIAFAHILNADEKSCKQFQFLLSKTHDKFIISSCIWDCITMEMNISLFNEKIIFNDLISSIEYEELVKINEHIKKLNS